VINVGELLAVLNVSTNITPVMNQAIATLRQFDQSITVSESQLKKLSANLGFNTTQMSNFGNALVAGSKGGVTALESLQQPYALTTERLNSLTTATQMSAYQQTLLGRGMSEVGMIMTGVSVAIGSMAKSIVDVGGAFETEMMHVMTLAGTTREEVNSLRESILALGPATGIGPAELAKGLFVLESYGLRGAAALDTLKVAAEMSALGMGTTTEAARGLTGILFSYKEQNLSAAEAGNLLAKTAALGNVRIAELVPAIARINPLAASMGIKFQDVATALAVFTHAGVDSAMAATGIRAMFGNILTDSVKTEKGFKLLSEALKDTSVTMVNFRKDIDVRGWTAAMLDLANKATKAGDEGVAALNKIFPNIRALTEVLAVYKLNGDMVVDINKRMYDSEDILGKGTKILSETWGFQWAQMKAVIENLWISLGESLMPVFKDLLELFKKGTVVIEGIIYLFTNLPLPVRASIVSFLGLITVIGPMLLVFGQLTMAIGNITRGLVALKVAASTATVIKFLEGPAFILATTALIALGGAFIYAQGSLENFGRALTYIGGSLFVTLGALKLFGAASTVTGAAWIGLLSHPLILGAAALIIAVGIALEATGGNLKNFGIVLTSISAALLAFGITLGLSTTVLSVFGITAGAIFASPWFVGAAAILTLTGIAFATLSSGITVNVEKTREQTQTQIDQLKILEDLKAKFDEVNGVCIDHNTIAQTLINMSPNLIGEIDKQRQSYEGLRDIIEKVTQAKITDLKISQPGMEAQANVLLDQSQKAYDKYMSIYDKYISPVKMVRTKTGEGTGYTTETAVAKTDIERAKEYQSLLDAKKVYEDLNKQIKILSDTRILTQHAVDGTLNSYLKEQAGIKATTEAAQKNYDLTVTLPSALERVRGEIAANETELNNLTKDQRTIIELETKWHYSMKDIITDSKASDAVVQAYQATIKSTAKEVKTLEKTETSRQTAIKDINSLLNEQGIIAVTGSQQWIDAAIRLNVPLAEISKATEKTTNELRLQKGEMIDSDKEQEIYARHKETILNQIATLDADTAARQLKADDELYASKIANVDTWEIRTLAAFDKISTHDINSVRDRVSISLNAQARRDEINTTELDKQKEFVSRFDIVNKSWESSIKSLKETYKGDLAAFYGDTLVQDLAKIESEQAAAIAKINDKLADEMKTITDKYKGVDEELVKEELKKLKEYSDKAKEITEKIFDLKEANVRLTAFATAIGKLSTSLRNLSSATNNESLKNITNILSNLTGSIQTGILAGQQLGKAWINFSSDSVGSTAKSLNNLAVAVINVATAMEQATQSTSHWENALSGAATGASIGASPELVAATGGWSVLAGAAAGGIYGYYKSTKSDDVTMEQIDQLMAQYGGVNEVANQWRMAGVTISDWNTALSAGTDDMEAFNLATKNITAAVAEHNKEIKTLTTAAAGINTMAAGINASTTQAQFERTGTYAVAIFARLLRETGSLTDSLAAVSDSLDAMAKASEDFGFTTSKALSQLLSLRGILRNNADLAARVTGLEQVGALGNMLGPMNLQTVFGEDLADTFNELMKRGANQSQALLLIQAPLQALWESTKNGLEQQPLSDDTQRILDMALSQGIIGENMRSIAENQLIVLRDIYNFLVGGTSSNPNWNVDPLADSIAQAAGYANAAAMESAASLGETNRGWINPQYAYPYGESGFAEGSGGFRDFGVGTLVTLHGKEAVIRPQDLKSIAVASRSVSSNTVEIQTAQKMLQDAKVPLIPPTFALNQQLPSYKEGSEGFQNFGTGTLAILHGEEAVIPLDNAQNTILKTNQILTQKEQNLISSTIDSFISAQETTNLKTTSSKEYVEKMINPILMIEQEQKKELNNFEGSNIYNQMSEILKTTNNTETLPVEGFAEGSGGFRDFGLGTPAVLHGTEAVIRPQDMKTTSSAPIVIEVPIYLDGRQIARSTVKHLPSEIKRYGIH
jgi:TP901 family phage tail tape measure protein